jgi:lipopolysaccharide biosynthesis glycosyltransferase
LLDNVLYDNVGENISSKNRRYCEMTAQYWAWKNEDADYYGLWHYRRYFAFNENIPTTVWGVINGDNISDQELEEFSILEEDMLDTIGKYDMILPQDWDIVYGSDKVESATIYEHWCHNLNKADIDLLIDVIHEKYPSYARATYDLIHSGSAPFNNMFIMKKELFNEYCEFAFDVLFEMESRIGDKHKEYSVEHYRTLGHVGERLVGIFANYKTQDPYIRIHRLPVVQWKDTTPKANKIKPAFPKKNTPIVLSFDNNYTNYAAVAINSLIVNASTSFNYDICVFHVDISESNQKRILNEYDNKNVSIRFINVSRVLMDYQEMQANAHITVETYYRYLIPELLECDKAIYLDSDLIVERDLSELFRIDIGDNFVGAVRDFDLIAATYDPSKKEFYQKEILDYLNLEFSWDYFQAGVLLLNLQKIRSVYTTEDFISRTVSRDWVYNDQDVLNYMFKGQVHYLPAFWNVISLMEANSYRKWAMERFLPATLSEEYNLSRANAGIVHFAGGYKPWNHLPTDLSEYFWKYAKYTSFYPELINSLTQRNNTHKLIFTTEYREDCFCPFIRLKGDSNPYGTNYLVCLIKSLESDINKSEFSKVSIIFNKIEDSAKVQWIGGNDMMNNSIKIYKVGHEVHISVKHNGMWNGYSLKILESQSRSHIIPVAEPMHDGYVHY